jgi:hypothetical protein
MSLKLSAELFNEVISTLTSDGCRKSGPEKRRDARVGLRCSVEITLCVFAAKKPKPVTVQVHDLSVSGIGLVAREMLEIGAEFVAKLHREGHPPMTVLYKVKHCRRLTKELFNVGAGFVRVLPDADGEVLAINPRKRRTANTAAEPTAPQVETTAA